MKKPSTKTTTPSNVAESPLDEMIASLDLAADPDRVTREFIQRGGFSDPTAVEALSNMLETGQADEGERRLRDAAAAAATALRTFRSALETRNQGVPVPDFECATPDAGNVLRHLELASLALGKLMSRQDADSQAAESIADVGAIIDLASCAIRLGKNGELSSIVGDVRRLHQRLEPDVVEAVSVSVRASALEAAQGWLDRDSKDVRALVNELAHLLGAIAADRKRVAEVVNATSVRFVRTSVPTSTAANRAVSRCKARLRAKHNDNAKFLVNAVARELGLDPKNWW